MIWSMHDITSCASNGLAISILSYATLQSYYSLLHGFDKECVSANTICSVMLKMLMSMTSFEPIEGEKFTVLQFYS